MNEAYEYRAGDDRRKGEPDDGARRRAVARFGIGREDRFARGAGGGMARRARRSLPSIGFLAVAEAMAQRKQPEARSASRSLPLIGSRDRRAVANR